MQDNMVIIEQGSAAFFNRREDEVIFESGHVYRKYGRKSENKVKLCGTQIAPDFDKFDEYYFQRHFTYIGEAKIVKIKRTLKLCIR